MTENYAVSAYLGDGVYAGFMPDKNQVVLYVERIDRPMQIAPEVRIERVSLEPEVFDALVRFAARCWTEESPP